MPPSPPAQQSPRISPNASPKISQNSPPEETMSPRISPPLLESIPRNSPTKFIQPVLSSSPVQQIANKRIDDTNENAKSNYSSGNTNKNP